MWGKLTKSGELYFTVPVKKKKVHLTLDLIAYGTRGLNDVSSFNQWLLARQIGRCLPKLSSFTMDKHTVSMHRLAPEICLNISWWGWGGVGGGGAVTRHGLARPWVCLSLSWGATPTPEFISLLGSAIARLMAVFIYANETWSASRRDGTRYDKYTGDGIEKENVTACKEICLFISQDGWYTDTK